MNQQGIPQLHIVPFDTGYMFYDVLSVDNTENLLLAEKFVEKLTIECVKHDIVITNNMELKYLGKTVAGIKYHDDPVAEQLICKAELTKNLYCYILANGIGLFVLADLESNALVNTDGQIYKYSKALIGNYQKKITQSTILNKYNGEDVFPKEEKLMLIFRELCWKVIGECITRKTKQNLRKYSGSKGYKADGLSYVLTIYLLKKGELTKNEINHLMSSTIFSQVTNPNSWEAINNIIEQKESEGMPESANFGDINTYYSWSAVAVETEKNFLSYADIIVNTVVATMLKAELYVQSRWFIADNSMDNVNKNNTCSMESLQRIASFIEFSQAELDNEISANMHSMYKQILSQIVQTSEVRKLYKSVASQISTQKKIKEAYYQDKKRKNKLIVDLFLVGFTAASFYKTVVDLINDKFVWWNYLIFAVAVVMALGTIIFNYKNK